MKIGIDARLWNETGVGRYIRNLVWQLSEIDTKNEYVLFVGKGYRVSGIGDGDSRFRIVETSIRWHSVEEQVKFPAVLEKEKLDLVHFPYFAIPIFYNKPFVVTIHDLIIHHFPTGEASTHHPLVYHGKRLGYEYIMKRAAQKSRKIITVSNATRQEIVDHLGTAPEKIVVTYEGVDEDLKSKIKIQNSKIQFKSQKYFLYVGNAYPHKYLERLLLAFEEISLKHRDISLVLVGKKDFFYKRLEKRIAELGLADTIQILQDVSDFDLQSLYRNAQAVVLPSLMEGFGLPAVEAMANLQKLIVSDIPAFREICGSAGIYFDPNDTKSLVEKLQEVLENPEDRMYLDKIKDGINRLENFSWENMAKQTLAVYKSAVE
jgi:glycosyltransferase involved in cell wall biosynthesis